MNLTVVPTTQFGWGGINCLIPSQGALGRCLYPSPLMLAFGAQGISTASLIAWAQADYQDAPAQPPKAGIPHYHVGGDGAIYQFVAESESPWAIDNQPFSPTVAVVLGQGMANPNTYGIFVTYESGGDLDVERPAYPNRNQFEALAELTRDIQTRFMGLPLVSYRQIHRSYEGSDSSDATLLSTIALLVAQPVPPRCNADVCLRESPTANSLLMTYDPISRCPTGLVPVESVSGETGFSITDGTTVSPVPTDGSGLVSFTDTTTVNFATSTTPNGGDVRATVIVSPTLDNRLSATLTGLYVPPDTGSGIDWCVLPTPAPEAFDGDTQTVLVWDAATGCIRRVPPTSVVAESLDWCALPAPDGASFSGTQTILVYDSADGCIKQVAASGVFASAQIRLQDEGSGLEDVAIIAPNNNITFISGNGISVIVQPTREVLTSIRFSILPDNQATVDGSGDLYVPPYGFDWCGLPVAASEVFDPTDHTFLVYNSDSECVVRVTAANVWAESISDDAGNLIVVGTDGRLYATIDWCNIPSLFNVVDPVDLSDQQFLSYDNATSCVVSSSGLALQTAILNGGNLSLADGTNALPSLAFGSSPTTGFFLSAPDEIGVTVAGVTRLLMGVNEIISSLPLRMTTGTIANVALGFSDTMGMWQSGGSSFSLVASGQTAATFGHSGGTAPTAGFLGASAVVRQSVTGLLTPVTIADVNAVLNSIVALIVAFGLGDDNRT